MTTDTLIPAAEAASRLHRSPATVRKLWRLGRLRGSMQRTIGNHPSRLMIAEASVEKMLADEARSPLDIARRGLPTGVLS